MSEPPESTLLALAGLAAIYALAALVLSLAPELSPAVRFIYVSLLLVQSLLYVAALWRA